MWRVTGIAIVTFALTSVSMRSQGLGVPEGLDLSGSWVARNFTGRPGESARYGTDARRFSGDSFE
jgi:hypothetical protein